MKWIGAAILIAAAYITGYKLASAEKRYTETVRSLIRLITFMKRRISGARTPLAKIFGEFNDDLLEQLGALEILRSRNRAASAWKDALAVLPLGSEIKTELELFGADLGALELSEQEKRMEVCLDALEKELEKLREELPKKQKSVKTVCLLAALMIVIILL